MIVEFLQRIFSFDDKHPLLFTQFDFWVFFIIVFAIFAVIEKNKLLMRNAFLFFVSVFFYYKTSGWFTLILVFSTIVNYFLGKWLFGAKSDGGKKGILILSLFVNLLTLCYFKYAYFFVDMVNSVCAVLNSKFDLSLGVSLGVHNIFADFGNIISGKENFSVDKIVLPVGISFYTFQSISYVMDIFRKRIEPVKNILDYGFYLTFFPQLVAGPIVRANTFLPQLYKPFFLGRRQFGVAIFWILNGFAKKIILSDYLAVNFVDRVFENPTMYTGPENLFALFAYSLQVYADFSGYTDIAIGVAMLMGFYLPQNFNSPYKAPNCGNFWKRWHISLSKWLQDYLYISMGGNREASFGTYAVIVTISLIGVILSDSIWVAVILLSITVIVSFRAYFSPDKRKNINSNFNRLNTMLLGGIWHGASWNFMIWGGLNGIGMLIFNFWKKRDIYHKTLVIMTCSIISAILLLVFDEPVYKIAFIWIGTIFVVTFVRMVYDLCGFKSQFKFLENCWAVFQTFVFITFTRLFFRSGSNLNPAEANSVAWSTAKNMVNQIGGTWDFSLIPTQLWEYRFLVALFIVGMLIHWIPEKIKRWYRLNFAMMPLPVMVIVSAVIVFVVYQFMSADLQKFIYFQF
ncbi:MAG: MBOAT family protein [Paludibacteraceae bacterium]|nr:MBOAT family protein [Paludibacteraceae bacterium]